MHQGRRGVLQATSSPWGAPVPCYLIPRPQVEAQSRGRGGNLLQQQDLDKWLGGMQNFRGGWCWWGGGGYKLNPGVRAPTPTSNTPDPPQDRTQASWLLPPTAPRAGRGPGRPRCAAGEGGSVALSAAGAVTSRCPRGAGAAARALRPARGRAELRGAPEPA